MTGCMEQAIDLAIRYPVYFVEDAFAPEQTLLAQLAARHRVLFAIDAEAVRRHPRLLIDAARYCDTHALDCDAKASVMWEGRASAEQAAWALHDALRGAHRGTPYLVLAIGGSVMLGEAGWAAASAGTPVRVVRIPTSAEAQCDAGLGLRNAAVLSRRTCIAYAPPHAVINAGSFLGSLAAPDWLAGCLHVLETALLHDRTLFEFVESAAPRLRARDLACLRAAIQRCAALRLRALAADALEQEKDVDLRAWAVQVAQQMTGHGLRRGEARAHAIVLGAAYARAAGLLSDEDWERLLAVLAALGFSPLAALRDRRVTWMPPETALATRAHITVPVAVGQHLRVPVEPVLWTRACRSLAAIPSPNSVVRRERGGRGTGLDAG